MNMKTLDVEKLSRVAGAEPRGTNNSGRQNDGTDIWDSGAGYNRELKGYVTNITYEDRTTVKIFPDGTTKSFPRP
jgi:hypothetical protein